ncbi:membrane lipoprotein lipid attachment site-containing protein [Planococcus sp. ISL-109]|uniref:membrane lipoprotein lipid attachment site-containing protein n=1 Tax=Planococcus sp. ISL-109 TaxID=2819166 RepID=UPI001BEA7A57|nr:membrane lipoprotein lipid attachment site-containing protein [Planococcus sp. ISL-109]MBT2583235.1 membrane lipoprotein lipid attachment site-containing protein [Planococcus sp. ISL-109]
MKKIIVLFTMAIILSGCTNGDRYNFSGNSDNWEVVYTVEVTDEIEQQTSGIIKYIGENKDPEAIDYKIEYKNENSNSTAGNSGEASPIKRGTAEFESTVCGNCAIIQKDEEIEAEITWNGQTETFLLKTNN